ncbi:hypothetical protein LTS08_001315 [Lithohypha guttulata]|nr:hypothetical protein LTS08_001315 [Lithohypha guttulata]
MNSTTYGTIVVADNARAHLGDVHNHYKADSMSIAIGCVSLTGGATNLMMRIGVFVSEVRNARKDMDADDIQKRNVAYDQILINDISQILVNCEMTMQQIETVLTKLSSGKLCHRINWAVSQQEQMDKLRSSLESSKTALEIALTVGSISMLATQRGLLEDVGKDITLVLQDTKVIITKTDAVLATTASIDRKIDVLSHMQKEDPRLDNINLEIHTLNEQLKKLMHTSSKTSTVTGLVEHAQSTTRKVLEPLAHLLPTKDELNKLNSTPNEVASGMLPHSEMSLHKDQNYTNILKFCPACSRLLWKKDEAVVEQFHAKIDETRKRWTEQLQSEETRGDELARLIVVSNEELKAEKAALSELQIRYTEREAFMQASLVETTRRLELYQDGSRQQAPESNPATIDEQPPNIMADKWPSAIDVIHRRSNAVTIVDVANESAGVEHLLRFYNDDLQDFTELTEELKRLQWPSDDTLSNLEDGELHTRFQELQWKCAKVARHWWDNEEQLRRLQTDIAKAQKADNFTAAHGQEYDDRMLEIMENGLASLQVELLENKRDEVNRLYTDYTMDSVVPNLPQHIVESQALRSNYSTLSAAYLRLKRSYFERLTVLEDLKKSSANLPKPAVNLQFPQAPPKNPHHQRLDTQVGGKLKYEEGKSAARMFMQLQRDIHEQAQNHASQATKHQTRHDKLRS